MVVLVVLCWSMSVRGSWGGGVGGVVLEYECRW